MNTPTLPEPVAAYFAADRQDGPAVARCFTSDAVVKDDGETHTGPAAIEAWKTATSARFAYTATPRSLEQQGRNVVVTSHVTGNFPGAPVDLRYSFTLERGKIASLEITA